MITARDIQKKSFEKVKFGYSPEEVDEFLSLIENDIRQMQQNLEDSNEKVQLLAEKVREYKDSEEDIKNVLLSAQKQARQVVAEATEKAAAIEAEAAALAEASKSQALIDQETRLAQVAENIEKENQNLAEIQKEVSDFKQTLFDLYKQHLELISRIPDETEEEEEYDDEEYEDEEEDEEEYEDEAEEAADEADDTAVDEPAASSFESRRDDAAKRF